MDARMERSRSEDSGCPRFAGSLETRSAAYEKVALAIRCCIEAKRLPGLPELAERTSLSPAHFQRVFADWAGISPKRFCQVLAQLRLRELLPSRSVLDAALDAGLSGPSRVHELFVTCEAMTPGEWKAGGARLELAYGYSPTPLGEMLLAWTDRGVCHASFEMEVVERASSGQRDDRGRARIAAAFPKASLREAADEAKELARRIFGEEVSPRPLHLLVKGSNFQIQVWRALLEIPAGTTSDYQTLAERIGRPSSARAVATAIASNQVGILIPCHRVLRRSGALAGYRWGVERKVAALLLERVGHGPERGV